MGIIDRTAVSGGVTSAEQQTLAQDKYLIERVSIAVDDNAIALTQTLPPYCEVIWYDFKLRTAVTVSGTDGTGTSDSIALLNSNATGVSTTTTNIVAQSGTTLTDGARSSGIPNITSNTASTAVSLFLAPAGTGARKTSINTNPTAGYHFDATGTVDVIVKYRQHILPEDVSE